MQTTGALADMERRGVKYVPQYCVDNAVVKVADPVFVGYCIEQGADIGGKAVAKVSWDEKVPYPIEKKFPTTSITIHAYARRCRLLLAEPVHCAL